MGSKSSSVYQTWESNDASQVQGLNAVRGDGNTVTVTDADAIKESMLFATRNADGTAKTLADVLGMVGTVASDAFKFAGDSSQKTLTTLAENGARSMSATADAYARAQNSGMKPETVLMIIAGIAGVFLIVRK